MQCTKSGVSNTQATCGSPVRVAFLGFWTVRTVLNPISGQVFDEGHGESGVLHSARWHGAIRWSMEPGRRGICASSDGEFRKVFDLAESLVTAL
ncbi:hypothetical protein TNCV_2784661 [Trichonephila clavipes]|nr:hypothetical protein TNCV_2784661 [Trichonephila clavipes]